MTPEERTLIDDLFRRLKDADTQPRDPDAERQIRDAILHNPNAAYYLTQAVLFQQQALVGAQQRIEEMERRIRDLEDHSPPPQPQSSGFLSGVRNLWGAPPPPSSLPAPRGSVPDSRPMMAAPGGASPWARQPAYPPAMPPMQAGYAQPAGGGFLQGAAQTAVGVAGGMLAAQAIGSLFNHGAAATAAATEAVAPVSETVINNYYNDPPAAPMHEASYDSGQDSGYDSGGDSGDDWT